jgi:hypothetical protein
MRDHQGLKGSIHLLLQLSGIPVGEAINEDKVFPIHPSSSSF